VEEIVMSVSKMRERLKIVKLIISTALISASLFATASGAQNKNNVADEREKLVGDWTGDSLCQGYRPACHDEKVVYHITKTPDKPDTVTLSADKIVDGKLELMGVLEFKYDSEKGTLTGEFTRGNTHGVWELVVKGDTMEGTLIVLPDKTLARRVKVKKEK
jgi:hypothetical protein